MKKSRIVIMKWTAVLLVIAVTVCSLLLTLRINKAARTDMNIPPQPSYATTLDRPHPEIRLEQLLNLDESNGFDPDLGSLLKRERERQQRPANQTGASYQQVAFVSHDQKGGH